MCRLRPFLALAAALGFAPGSAQSAEEAAASAAGGALRPAPVTRSGAAADGLSEFLTKVDPASDATAWSAEAFAERAGAVLKELDATMAAGVPDDASGDAASPEFTSPAPRPSALREVFRDTSLVVRRGEPDLKPLVDRGTRALRATLRSWIAAYPAGTEVHTKFKIVGVEVDAAAGTAMTRVFVQSAGETAAGIAQQSATWECLWRTGGEAPPKLTAITVTGYEEVQPAPAAPASIAGPLFVDAAPLVLGNTAAWNEILVHSLDHWFRQVDAAFQIPQGYHGVSVRDVDGDDREDVFLCQPAGIRKMLFRRQPDGTLKDISKEAGVDFLDNSRSALFADLDNDGDADLVLTLNFGIVIFANDGKGHFSYRSKADLASWPMSVVAADYDLDGDLDLYLCGYNPRESVKGADLLATPVPYHDANNGARNFLIRNDGNWKFTDATGPAGLDVNNRRFSLAAAWEDYDNDGDQDLYVVNDFGRKNFFRNDLISEGRRQSEAKFVDVAAAAGVEDIGAGMSGAWADYDHDGLMDLYVANMFSSAGRRIAFQSQFKTSEKPEELAGYRRHSRGNSLFRNDGKGGFQDVSEGSGTVLGRWAWASLFADLNNDSWEDLYVCNGFYTRPDPGDL